MSLVVDAVLDCAEISLTNISIIVMIGRYLRKGLGIG